MPVPYDNKFAKEQYDNNFAKEQYLHNVYLLGRVGSVVLLRPELSIHLELHVVEIGLSAEEDVVFCSSRQLCNSDIENHVILVF